MTEKINYDYTMLTKLIKDRGYNHTEVAMLSGMSKGVFSLKINNKLSFSQKDILALCEVLRIPKTKVYEYFFTKKV